MVKYPSCFLNGFVSNSILRCSLTERYKNIHLYFLLYRTSELLCRKGFLNHTHKERKRERKRERERFGKWFEPGENVQFLVLIWDAPNRPEPVLENMLQGIIGTCVLARELFSYTSVIPDKHQETQYKNIKETSVF